MMVVGLGTVAGSTMVAYATILSPVLPNAAGHVLVASIVSAPAGVLLARIIIPEKEGMGGAVAEMRARRHGPQALQRGRGLAGLDRRGGLGGGEEEAPAGPPSRWSSPERLVRPAVHPSRGGWAASALPR